MASLTSYIWPPNMISSPIHVCQQNTSRTGNIIKWALRPFFDLQHVPMEVSKSEDKTIVKIETQRGRIVDGVQCFAGLAQKTLNLPGNPLKIEMEDTKTIITMELKNWIFCDCDLPLTDPLPVKGEDEADEEEDEEEMLMRILPECSRTTPGKAFSSYFCISA